MTFRRLTSIFILAAMLLAIFPFGTIQAEITSEFAGGTGTEADPYLIETKYHLDNMRKHLSSYFKMIADIQFSEDDFSENGDFYNNGRGWNPIGSIDASFSGHIDGNGYVIKNLYINVTSDIYSSVGLFAYNEGEIINLGIVYGDLTITENTNTDSAKIGAITGTNYENGEIINCFNVSKVTGLSAAGYWVETGGLVGDNRGIVTQCYNSGRIFSERTTGGIVGINRNESRVSDSFNSGTVLVADGGISGQAGGIASMNFNESNIYNCYNIGTVYVAIGAECGAICGNNSGNIYDCYYLNKGILAVGDWNYSIAAINSFEYSLNEMMEKENYYSFDFKDVWELDANDKYPLPKLKKCEYFYGSVVDNRFAGGDGTLFNPYLVETKEQLNLIQYHLDENFKLIDDITFTDQDFSAGGIFHNNGRGFVSIGDQNNPFAGTFDGNNKIVSGLYINTETSEKVEAGFFGYNAGNIVNLYLENLNILATSTSDSATAGGICVSNSGYITNCVVTGGISSRVTLDYRSAYSGGITVWNNGVITNCVNEAKLSSRAIYYNGTHASGICCSSSGIIEDCENFGTLVSTDNSGGIVGSNSGSVLRCSNYASFSISDLYVGGIAGQNTGIIKNCINMGNISSGSQKKGGIVGYNYGEQAIVEYCRNLGDVRGGSYSGGIAGNNEDSAIVTKCYNSGIIDSMATSGGIVGLNYNGKISDSYNTGDIKGIEEIGGIAGNNRNGKISNCYNVGKIDVSKYSTAGPIKGYGSVSENCYYLDTSLNQVVSGTDVAVCLTSTMMETKDSFVDFDFLSIWSMSENSNYRYPQLKNAETISLVLEKVEIIKSFKTNYKYKVDNLEITGGVVLLHYKDGYKELVDLDVINNIYGSTLQEVTGFNNSRVGVQTISIPYKTFVIPLEIVIIADTSTLFEDVKSSAWYKQYIDYSVTYGILSGAGNGKMLPNKTMTRAEFVQVLANLAGVDTSNKNITTEFTDVKSGHWFAPAVKWASENGIVSGMGEGKFAPNANITREQMCSMLVRYVENYLDITLESIVDKKTFADDNKISSWAKDAVYKCQQSGLVNGVSETMFAPRDNATRAAVATIMSKFHEQYLK